MSVEKPKKLGFKRIYFNLDKILFLFFLIFMLVEYLWLPLNSALAGLLLSQTGFLFISHSNFLAILISSPFVSLAFFLLFLVNLLVAYFQISLLFIGARHLLYHEKRTVLSYTRNVFRQTLLFLRQTTLSKLAFVFFYIALLFPFIRKILKIYYLDKIVIPDFVITYLEGKYLLVGVFTFCSAWIMLYIAVRLMFALPKIFFEKSSVGEAVRYSLEKTRKKIRFYGWHLFGIVTKTYLFFFLCLLPVLLLGGLIDLILGNESLLVALLSFVLIKNLHYMTLTYFLVKFVSFLTGEELEILPRRKKDHLMRWGVMGCASVFFSIEGYVYLAIPQEYRPLVISHRGVSNGNGVQNTVESLEKTATLGPDFVEMDVQETKDGQFVMMHDPTLRALAGVNARPQDLTLEELTQLDISENGYQTKISSFDAYFNRANELNQKLLIEIKTSKKDSPQMMQRFLERYGEDIKAKGHEMQSLDYHVVEQVLAYDASIPVYFILPYNTVFPRTAAKGYTMEYSTLDENFVTKLWTTDQKLYDWTINTDEAVEKSLRLGVDGMITDNLDLVQEAISESRDNPRYMDLLLNKAVEFFNF